VNTVLVKKSQAIMVSMCARINVLHGRAGIFLCLSGLGWMPASFRMRLTELAPA
jgi:hypothetical protein